MGNVPTEAKMTLAHTAALVPLLWAAAASAQE
jgi:hypothetical protein